MCPTTSAQGNLPAHFHHRIFAAHMVLALHLQSLHARHTRERADLHQNTRCRQMCPCLAQHKRLPRSRSCTRCCHRTPCTSSSRPCSKGRNPRPRQTGYSMSRSSRRSRCSTRPAAEARQCAMSRTVLQTAGQDSLEHADAPAPCRLPPLIPNNGNPAVCVCVLLLQDLLQSCARAVCVYYCYMYLLST
jgi:hypothetical protein